MKYVWKRRDGRCIELRKLGNSYILNIIGVLDRVQDIKVRKLFPPYRFIVEEAERRKLVSKRKKKIWRTVY